MRSKAQDIVELANRLEQEFSSSGQTVSGEISIGAGETVAMRGIAQIIRQIQMQWPAIRCHIFSGNAEDVIGRLDSGLLDFGVLIQPVNIDKYDFITLPDRDIWGVIMRKDSPFAACEQITREELMQMPLICSRQVMLRIRQEYSFNDWFRGIREQLNIVATYNLIYNAAVMVDEGVGYALTLDQLVNVTNHRHLCFRPLSPRLESGLNIVWKKNRVFAPAAQLFLEALRENYPNGIPGKKEK